MRRKYSLKMRKNVMKTVGLVIIRQHLSRLPLRKSHMLPTCEPRVFHMGTHVFHIKAHIFHLFSQNVINCPM